ncbi:ParB/RepB/Spo0J family partition protein [Streptococcus himalayensis]|uniref:Chromosome partitioning protein ParB n=1 Tax=Streptococcus himalayensis TaxID=1888195 RepID=A0A917A411_9STRE|nr:ParB/RepB/Spo0J family partition protein [Streptococcus himalayensis]GGE23995.1 chromosome partitioning protein ParB [Streptococcus himalayensis]
MEHYQQIPLSDIQVNPYQPRKEFDPKKLQELAQSIRENGIIQPIIVRKSNIIGYELLAGERRFRAAKLAGLTKISAIIKELSDDDMIQHAIIENLQRENLNPIEEAESYQHLIDRGLTHQEIAESIGKSRPYISNILRLLALPDDIQKSVKDGRLSQAHARVLIPLKKEEQEHWFQIIEKEAPSVRWLEKAIQTSTLNKKTNQKSQFIQAEEEKLRKKLGVEVQIKIRSQKEQNGTLSISFSNLEEYQRIINSFK